MSSIKLGSAGIAACVLGSLFASICRADYTEEQGVSLEWMTDSSKAIAVVEPVKDGEYNWGWPMRIVRILKADPRVKIGQVHRVQDNRYRSKPLDRGMIFLHENEKKKLVVHQACGRDMHEGHRHSPVIKLYGFDREGRFVQSLDQAIDIVTRRVKRGPNLPEPDYCPHGKFFVTRHSKSAYGIRRCDDRKLVCELESNGTGLYLDPTTLRFTADERTVFCSRFGKESSNLSVFDLESGEQISKKTVGAPFFRIRDVYPGSTFLLSHRANGRDYHLFNWRTGRFGHRLEPGSRLPEVSPNDKTVAYVRSEPSDDEISPDTFSLVIEELASRQVLRTIGLPCKPKELRFIAGGQTVMTILELTAWQHRRNVALLYGVQPNDMDGETISWTPSPN